jgi:hypothetical protein
MFNNLDNLRLRAETRGHGTNNKGSLIVDLQACQGKRIDFNTIIRLCMNSPALISFLPLPKPPPRHRRSNRVFPYILACIIRMSVFSFPAIVQLYEQVNIINGSALAYVSPHTFSFPPVAILRGGKIAKKKNELAGGSRNGSTVTLRTQGAIFVDYGLIYDRLSLTNKKAALANTAKVVGGWVSKSQE